MGSARAAYHAHLGATTRRSALAAGVVLLIAFPLWAVFDILVAPAHAAEFIVVRAVFEGPIALGVLALRRPDIGGRWPEQTAFGLLLLPQVAIAWMVPRSEPQLTAYLLGFSLIIFGSAVVVVWRWQLTAWLTGATLLVTAISTALATPALPTSADATMLFYLGTAGVVAVVGQLYRYQAGWDQFVTQAALEEQRRRNDTLVEELRRLSGEDPLTGVANRRKWESWCVQEYARAQRDGRPFAVILCDFDRFKDVNDCYGHAFGDEVLRAGAAAIHQAARSTDLVARLGGDEFVVACPNTSADEATELAHRLAVSTRALHWPAEVIMTLSFGVAELGPGDADVAALLLRADAALYQAKTTRDCVVLAAAS